MFVPGKPAAQGSKRHIGNGVLIESSARVRPWRTDVREAIAASLPANWSRQGGMKVVLDFRFLRPKSHYTSKGMLTKRSPIYPTGRVGDLDKLARAVMDAATSIAFEDDSQVIQLICSKGYCGGGEQCGVRIKVEGLGLYHA